jgi:hypothetical protein
MSEHNLRYFMLNNLAIESAIQSVETKSGLDFGHRKKDGNEQDQIYYPQFSRQVREDAERMAQNYILFYSLENSIRDLITDVLSEKHGENWWIESGVVPEIVVKSAENNQKRKVVLASPSDPTE